MCRPGSTSSLCYFNPTLPPSYWRLIYTPILNQRWIRFQKYLEKYLVKYFQISWLCNGDFVKESDRKQSSLASMEGERNKWAARMTIMVSESSQLNWFVLLEFSFHRQFQL